MARVILIHKQPRWSERYKAAVEGNGHRVIVFNKFNMGRIIKEVEAEDTDVVILNGNIVPPDAVRETSRKIKEASPQTKIIYIRNKYEYQIFKEGHLKSHIDSDYEEDITQIEAPRLANTLEDVLRSSNAGGSASWEILGTDRLARIILDDIGKEAAGRMIGSALPEHTNLRARFISPGFSGAKVIELVTERPVGGVLGNDYFVVKFLKDKKAFAAEWNNYRKHCAIIDNGIIPKMIDTGFFPVEDYYCLIYRKIVSVAEGGVRDFAEYYLENDSEANIGTLLCIFNDVNRIWYETGRSTESFEIFPFHKDKEFYFSDNNRLKICCEMNRIKKYLEKAVSGLETIDSSLGGISGVTAAVKDFLLNQSPRLEISFKSKLAVRHGDFNPRNILLCLNGDSAPSVFLIDFEKTGEGLPINDVAKMESSIKYVLMNYENGRDIDWSLLPLWLSLESETLKSSWLDFSAGAMQNSGPVGTDVLHAQKAFAVIAALRNFASNISTTTPEEFNKQYAFALLFHSIHSIGFADVPISKKIYAMVSAAAILKWLHENKFI